MISTSEVRITCMIAEDELETALRALHDAVRAGAARADRRRRRSSRLSRRADGRRSSRAWSDSPASARPTTSFATGWPAARRRSAWPSPTSRPPAAGATGRTWIAPPGAALLLSLGFRPTWLAAGSGLAAGGDRLAGDGRRGRGGRRPARRGDPPEVAERPGRRIGRHGHPQARPVSSARPRALGRPTRG